MKNIWIFNHYATNAYLNKGGRHYWFAKYLLKDGYKPTIFCANTVHNKKDSIILDNKKYIEKTEEGIKFVFIRADQYEGNGLKRIKNILSFYKNIFTPAKEIAKKEKPDIILASSVHPLTLVAGIKIAKKLKVPCICEVRDLWPLTLIEMGKLKNNSIISKMLYKGELWIYKNANSIIFTGEGEKEYIKDMEWESIVDLNKTYYINNGIDYDVFYDNIVENTIDDLDLESHLFKVVYTGSLRPANDVSKVVDVAEYIFQSKYRDKIVFLIYGDGNERKNIELEIKKRNIGNIKIKGMCEKKYVPYILSKSNLNLLHYSNKLDLFKYGGSQNKLFEYFASGKPILSTVKMKPDIIGNYKCGFTTSFNKEDIANTIIYIYNMTQFEYSNMCKNARNAAIDYDFKNLTKKLEKVINNTCENKHVHDFD